LSNDISNQFVNKEVFKTAIDRSITALNAGNNVIFDATNIESIYRKEMLKFIKQNVNREFDAFAKVFQIDPEISKERIKKDLELNINRSNVPPEIIDTQHKTFLKDLDKIESDGYKILEKVSNELPDFEFAIDIRDGSVEDINNAINEFEKYTNYIKVNNFIANKLHRDCEKAQLFWINNALRLGDVGQYSLPWAWHIIISNSFGKKKIHSPITTRFWGAGVEYMEDIITLKEFLNVGLAGVKDYIEMKREERKFNSDVKKYNL
jgi:predicted kinase